MAENIFYDADGKEIDINSLPEGSRLYNEGGQEINSEGGIVIRDVLGNVLNPTGNEKKEPVKILGLDGNVMGEPVKVNPIVNKLGQEIDANAQAKPETVELVDKNGNALDADGNSVIEPVTLLNNEGNEIDAEGNVKPIKTPEIEVVERVGGTPRESIKVTEQDGSVVVVNDDGSAVESLYNEQGKLRKTITYFDVNDGENDGSKRERIEQEFDSNGLMTSEWSYANGGAMQSATFYRPDTDQVRSTVSVNEDGSAVETVYGENGNVEKSVTYFDVNDGENDGSKRERIEQEFDSNGLMTSEWSYANGGAMQSATFYRPDTDQIRSTVSVNEDGSAVETVYDENGNVEKVLNIDNYADSNNANKQDEVTPNSMSENEAGFEVDQLAASGTQKEPEPEHYPDAISDMQSDFTGEPPAKMSLEDIERFWREWNEEKKDINYIGIYDAVVNVEFNSGTKLKDSGDKISMEAGKGQDLPPDQDFDKIMEAAEKRGWRAIKFGPNCSPEFAAKLYLACAKAGMKPIGYEPSPELKAQAMEIAKDNGYDSWGTENYKRLTDEEKEPALLEDRTTETLGKLHSFSTKYINKSQDECDLKEAVVIKDISDKQFADWKSRVGQSDLSDNEKAAIDKYKVAERDVLGKDEQISTDDFDEKHTEAYYDAASPARADHYLKFYASEKAKILLSQKKCEDADAVPDGYSMEEFSQLANKIYVSDKREAILNDISKRISSNKDLTEEQLNAKLTQAGKDVKEGKLDAMTPSPESVMQSAEKSKLILYKGENLVNKTLESGKYSGRGEPYNPEQKSTVVKSQTNVNDSKAQEKAPADNTKPNVIIRKDDGRQ